MNSSAATTSTLLSKKLTRLCVVLFTIYVAYLCASLIWFVVEEPQPAMPISFSKDGDSSQARQVLRPVDRYHLFGRPGAAQVVAEAPKEAPKTRLRLLLKGVFTGEDGGRSGAIIEEIGKSAEYYKLGDSLPGNVKLAEVYADRVILDRAGNYEALFFEESSKASVISAVVSQPRRKAGNVRTPEDFIEEATARLSENPEQALNSVGLGVSDGGGYVFKGNNPMLAGMNLKKGDVIRSVNGHTLGDVNKDKEMMREIYQQGSVEVEVVRDGASFFVNYPLR